MNAVSLFLLSLDFPSNQMLQLSCLLITLSRGCWGDVALNLTSGLSPLSPHGALIQARVLGAGLLDQQGGDLVLHGDADPIALRELRSIVAELQVGLVPSGEADVEPDVVPLVDVHLLHRPHGLGGGLHDVLLAVLNHVEVGAALGGPDDVLEETGEHSTVVGAGLGDGERGAGVGGQDLEILGVLHGEAVSVPLHCGVWLAAKLNNEAGRLSLLDSEGLQGLGKVGSLHVLLELK